MININDIISDLNEKYAQALSCIEPGYSHDEEVYSKISSILKFITSSYKVSQSQTDEAVLTFGKTGWGKSTSINYLNGSNLIVTARGGLAPPDAERAVTPIGNGDGSTTLYPEYCDTCFGKVYDLPGDEETRGIVPEIINCVSKKGMGKVLKKLKILLVMPASTFTHQGSYGRGLKDILAANDKFLMDINRYKDNIIFLITSVNRRPNEPQQVKKNILQCLQHKDKALEKYRELIEHVFRQDRVRMIPKPSDEDEEGAAFTVPAHQNWKIHQREEIVNEIRKLPSRICSQQDFSVPYNPKITEDLTKVLRVLVEKAKKEIQEKFTKVTLSGVQLRFFHSLLKKLRSNQKRTLSQFQQLFTQNEYLQFPELDQVQKCLKLISEFLVSNSKQTEYYENWVTENLERKISQMLQKVENLRFEKGGDFRKQLDSDQLLVKPNSAKFSQLKYLTNQLKNTYTKISQNQLKKQNQQSQFYTTCTQKIQDKTVQQSYTDTEHYIQYETREKTVKVERLKTSTQTINRQRVLYRKQKEKYRQQVPKVRKVKRNVITYENIPVWKGFFPLITYQKKEKIVEAEVDEAYYEEEQKQRDIVVPYVESYQEQIPIIRAVLQDDQITQQVPVTKTRQITKYRDKQEYKQQQLRKFNKAIYDTAQAKLRQNISQLKQKIMKAIDSAEKSQRKAAALIFEVKEQVEKNYLDLLNQWCESQHKAFYKYHPNKLLDQRVQVQQVL